MRRFPKMAVTMMAGCIFSLLGGWAADSADAHGVIVFAWAEGERVYVESKFSGGRKINRGSVIVEDRQGSLLLTGTTDAQGRFDFRAPVRADLKIIVQAGTGHQGQWTVAAAEFAAPGRGQGEKPALPQPAAAVQPPGRDDQSDPAPIYTAADLAAVEAVVDKALERKLKPVVQMLADARQCGPGLKDILGGMGYIFGLVGLAAYIHSRKRA